MRKIPIWKLTILLPLLIAAGWFVYKSQVTPVTPPPHGPAHTAPNAHKKLKISGKVIGYAPNPDGDIDKMLLGTGDEQVQLHFPPHAARSIKTAAPPGSTIEVTIEQGGPGLHHAHAFELKSVQNPDTKINIDLTDLSPPPPRKGFEVEVKGRISTDLKREPGRDNQFILSGKIISIPPHMARELFPLIRRAKVILVKGAMRDSTEGFLSATGMPVVKANSVRLDSITYKIR